MVLYAIDYCFSYIEFDGLFISNGPGNPQMCSETITNIQTLLKRPGPKPPVFGICLGHQLLALAAGASSYKMKLVNVFIMLFNIFDSAYNCPSVVTFTVGFTLIKIKN